MDELTQAHLLMIYRYKELLIESLNNYDNIDYKKLIKFCDAAYRMTNPDKLSRWVGFIQGVLYCSGLIDIDEERDFSRKIYKPIYDEIGYDSSTVDITK